MQSIYFSCCNIPSQEMLVSTCERSPEILGQAHTSAPCAVSGRWDWGSRWVTAPAENRRPLLHLPWSVPARWPMPSAIRFLSAAPCVPAPRACLDEEGVESADLPDARPACCQHNALPGFNRPTPAVAGKMGSEPPLGFRK